jgi:hypothetical protein
MKRSLTIVLVSAALAVSAFVGWQFQQLIVEKYAHFQELVLTLKLGTEPTQEGILESNLQGHQEGYAQLGAYTLCVIVFVLSAIAVVKLLITSGSLRRE